MAMFIYQSMYTMILFIGITAYFIVLFSLRKNPWSAANFCVQELRSNWKYLLHFLAMIAILIFNKIELLLEKKMRESANFTPSFYRWEGDLVYYIQNFFENEILTAVLSYFYVIVFPALLVASVIIYISEMQPKLFFSLCYAIAINYMVAIPFYLFFPVEEVWYFHYKVDFFMLDVFPEFETVYRPLSGLDNCFPSLHTSISVSLALIALRSGYLLWGRFALISMGIIIFSIFYLGIHWVTDMIGGVILGFFAVTIAFRIADVKETRWAFSVPAVKNRHVGKYKW